MYEKSLLKLGDLLKIWRWIEQLNSRSIERRWHKTFLLQKMKLQREGLFPLSIPLERTINLTTILPSLERQNPRENWRTQSPCDKDSNFHCRGYSLSASSLTLSFIRDKPGQHQCFSINWQFKKRQREREREREREWDRDEPARFPAAKIVGSLVRRLVWSRITATNHGLAWPNYLACESCRLLGQTDIKTIDKRLARRFSIAVGSSSV